MTHTHPPTRVNAHKFRPALEPLPGDRTIDELRKVPSAVAVLKVLYNGGENLQGGIQISATDLAKRTSFTRQSCNRVVNPSSKPPGILVRLRCVSVFPSANTDPHVYRLTSLGVKIARQLLSED